MRKVYKYDVFISHSTQDERLARNIASSLFKLDFHVWRPSQKRKLITNELIAAMENAAVCLLLFGPDGDSPWADKFVWSAIIQRIHRSHGKFRVIPILFPKIFEVHKLLSNWKEPSDLWDQTGSFLLFQNGLDEEAINRLVLRIRGVDCSRKPIWSESALLREQVRGRAKDVLDVNWAERLASGVIETKMRANSVRSELNSPFIVGKVKGSQFPSVKPTLAYLSKPKPSSNWKGMLVEYERKSPDLKTSARPAIQATHESFAFNHSYLQLHCQGLGGVSSAVRFEEYETPQNSAENPSTRLYWPSFGDPISVWDQEADIRTLIQETVGEPFIILCANFRPECIVFYRDGLSMLPNAISTNHDLLNPINYECSASKDQRSDTLRNHAWLQSGLYYFAQGEGATRQMSPWIRRKQMRSFQLRENFGILRILVNGFLESFSENLKRSTKFHLAEECRASIGPFYNLGCNYYQVPDGSFTKGDLIDQGLRKEKVDRPKSRVSFISEPAAQPSLMISKDQETVRSEVAIIGGGQVAFTLFHLMRSKAMITPFLTCFSPVHFEDIFKVPTRPDLRGQQF